MFDEETYFRRGGNRRDGIISLTIDAVAVSQGTEDVFERFVLAIPQM